VACGFTESLSQTSLSVSTLFNRFTAAACSQLGRSQVPAGTLRGPAVAETRSDAPQSQALRGHWRPPPGRLRGSRGRRGGAAHRRALSSSTRSRSRDTPRRGPTAAQPTRRERIRLAGPAPTSSLLEREYGEVSAPTSPAPPGEAPQDGSTRRGPTLEREAACGPCSLRSCSRLPCRSWPSTLPPPEPASPSSCASSSSRSKSQERPWEPPRSRQQTARVQDRQALGRQCPFRPCRSASAGAPYPVEEGSSGATVVATARRARTRSRVRRGRPFDGAHGDDDRLFTAGAPWARQSAEVLGGRHFAGGQIRNVGSAYAVQGLQRGQGRQWTFQ